MVFWRRLYRVCGSMTTSFHMRKVSRLSRSGLWVFPRQPALPAPGISEKDSLNAAGSSNYIDSMDVRAGART